MNILITGCAGFIGFHLCNEILKKNPKYKIFGIDNLNHYYDVKLKKERLKILKKNNKFFFHQFDITNKKKVKYLFKKNNFYSVINLAAQAGVRYSLTNPDSYINNNIKGFLNIIEECKNYKINHLIYASTSSIYGGNDSFPFKENQNTDKPLQLYAVTKKTNELMAHAYSSLYQLPSTGLRFFTVYGPWGRPDMSLFMFTKNILEKKPIKVFNNGIHIRDFTYVTDIVNSIIKLIPKKPMTYFDSSKGIPYRILNIGSDNPIKLMYFIKLIEKNLDMKAKIKFETLQLGDVKATKSDSTYLKRIINYKPATSIEDGVKNFIDWYKDFYKIK
jgi:UDP-glucuronate 4-epimerase